MSYKNYITKRSEQVLVRSLFLSAILVSFVGDISTKPSRAQSITPEPSGTDTTVTPSGSRFDIGGGQLSQDGKNLFHSFTNFGLQQNQIANFLSQPTIQNILSRVTSGNASVINGIIQVSGGNSNLFLMNPGGIIFGRNASLNVPASFTATTANGIGFGSNGWFNAVGSNNYASLVGTPSTLAFAMMQPGAILNAANLEVGQGENITLVGATVASTGQLRTPGGNIIVAAVPGTSLVRLSQPGSPLSLEIQPISSGDSQPTAWRLPVLPLAELLTQPGAGSARKLTVNTDGTVQLTGSGIRVENGDVVAGNINTSSTTNSVNGGSILLSAQGNINTTGGTLNSSYSATGINSAGNGGVISLTSQRGNITTGDLDSHAMNENTGNGGAIALTALGNIATGRLSSSNSAAGGNGGAITLTSQNGNIATDDLDSSSTTSYGGDGGAIALATLQGNIATGTLDSHGSVAGGSGSGRGGAIALATQNGNIATGTVNSVGSGYASGYGGAIALTTRKGNIATNTLNASAGAQVAFGGAITLATQEGNIATGPLYSRVSGGRGGNGGAITLNTQQGDIATGDLDASSNAAFFGNGGAVTITASNSITSDKINSSSSPASGSLFTPSNGGSVTLSARKDITVSSIDAQGGSNGTGGTVNILTAGLIRVSGSFTARDGVTTASISTQGGTGGGQIRIVNGGGLENLFRVGDATTNGTAKDITSGNYRISSTPIFTVPSPIYTQGNIEIITLP